MCPIRSAVGNRKVTFACIWEDGFAVSSMPLLSALFGFHFGTNAPFMSHVCRGRNVVLGCHNYCVKTGIPLAGLGTCLVLRTPGLRMRSGITRIRGSHSLTTNSAVPPCNLLVHCIFDWMHCYHLQSRRVGGAWNNHSLPCLLLAWLTLSPWRWRKYGRPKRAWAISSFTVDLWRRNDSSKQKILSYVLWD
jgi:hypothetical protein